MKKRKIIFNVAILILVTGLTIYYLIDSDLFQNLHTLKDISLFNMLAIILLLAIFVMLESYIIYTSIKKINSEAHYKDAVGAYLMGNLGSSITPWKSGHFPFMAYYYKRKKYSLEETINIVADNHLVYSMCLSILYLIFMIVGIACGFEVKMGEISMPLYIFTLFGVISNILYIVGIIILIKNEKLHEKILKLQLWFVKRFSKKINLEEFEANKRIKMAAYRKSYEELKHNFKRYVLPVLAYLVCMLINYGLPYFIYLFLSKASFMVLDYIQFFMLSQAMRYVSNIIPIPGGTGVMEYSFLVVYSSLMTDMYVSSCLLIWRFGSYFLFIIIDFIYFLIFNSKNQIGDIKEYELEKNNLPKEG